MKRPLLLDLFCGAGGCAMGYHRAGFDVVGVDIKKQPRYPFRFIQGDAMEYLANKRGRGFQVIHASPPCQRYSEVTRANGNQENYPDLVAPCRDLLAAIGKPWVIENVPFAPLGISVMLCGTYFGLRVIRHRLFESSRMLMSPGRSCSHPPRGAVGRAGVRGKKVGDWISVAGDVDRKVASHAMGIDWMTRHELAQAIPPAYTEFIGRQLIAAI